MNTAIFSPSGASAGVGFAVPVDTVNRVVPQLIGGGKYARPALGIEVDEGLNRIVLQRLRTEGVAVLRVTPGSAAEVAGLRGARIDNQGVEPGDVIVAVNGKPVESVARLLSRLDDYRAGDTGRLGILRDGRKTEVSVKLQAGSQSIAHSVVVLQAETTRRTADQRKMTRPKRTSYVCASAAKNCSRR